MNKPITLTLVFETREQAMAVLEAYGEVIADGYGETRAQHGNSDAAVSTRTIPEYKPVPHPNPAPGYASNGKENDVPETDERGVPWHVDHHSSSKKQSKGAWDRKRGHNRPAADAYEAQFVGKPVQAAAPAPTANASPSVQAPAQTLITLQQFQDLWVRCCSEAKVTMDDQVYLEQTFGGHPMTAVYEDGLKRSNAYAYLQRKLNG